MPPGDLDQPSLLARLISGSDQWQRTRSGALFAGLAGAAAFVASLVSEWERITVSTANQTELVGQTYVAHASAGSVETLGFVYIAGGVALMALVGAMITEPALAIRHRGTGAGLSVGLMATVIALALRMREGLDGTSMAGLAFLDGAPRTSVTAALQPGILCAVSAVVLLLAAVLLAGPSRRTPARPAAVPVQPPEPESSAWISTTSRTVAVSGLTVTAADAREQGDHWTA